MKTIEVKFTQWNTASKSLSENIVCALESIKTMKYIFIVDLKPNEEHEQPLKKINGALNNPFNWKCISTFHRSKEEISKAVEIARNETEKDLILNWVPVFGSPEAIKLYQDENIFTQDLIRGVGTASQVRRIDLINFLKENGEKERAELFENPNQFFNSSLWVPKDNNYYENESGNTYAVYFIENLPNLSIEELNTILDNSVKKIINN